MARDTQMAPKEGTPAKAGVPITNPTPKSTHGFRQVHLHQGANDTGTCTVSIVPPVVYLGCLLLDDDFPALRPLVDALLPPRALARELFRPTAGRFSFNAFTPRFTCRPVSGGTIGLPLAARLPITVPAAPPTTAPSGPAIIPPMTAPATPPTVCLVTGSSSCCFRSDLPRCPSRLPFIHHRLVSKQWICIHPIERDRVAWK